MVTWYLVTWSLNAFILLRTGLGGSAAVASSGQTTAAANIAMGLPIGPPVRGQRRVVHGRPPWLLQHSEFAVSSSTLIVLVTKVGREPVTVGASVSERWL